MLRSWYIFKISEAKVEIDNHAQFFREGRGHGEFRCFK